MGGIYTLDEIKAIIQPIAVKYRLPAVYVFGSYARNEATADSDVDILVDLTGSEVKGWIIGELYNDLCDGIKKGVDLVTTRSLMQDVSFSDNVMRERVAVYE